MAFLISIQMVDNSAEKIKDYKKKKKKIFQAFPFVYFNTSGAQEDYR